MNTFPCLKFKDYPDVPRMGLSSEMIFEVTHAVFARGGEGLVRLARRDIVFL